MLKKDDGSLQSRYEWPKNGGKLKDVVVFNLNRDMHVRIVSKSNIVLNFTSSRETAKIQLGSSNQITFDDMTNVSFLNSKEGGKLMKYRITF